jgi:signal transduction histidine kinase
MFGRRAEEVVGADFGFPVRAGETTEFDIVAHLHFCQDPERRQATVVEMRVVESEWNGESVLLATLRDITLRRHAEQELRTLYRELTHRAAQLESANRELDAFSYTVSHDLRTPLTVIGGMGQLLLERNGAGMDAAGLDMVRTIVGEAERMDAMIGALLNFAQVTLGSIASDPVDLSQLARTLSVKLQFREPARRAEFRIQDGVVVQGDPTLLHNVMENLMGNAWKFTGRRERTVIEFGTREDGGEAVCFVRDNGVGFAMADAERIFGTFQRLDNGSGFTGTGVGLATVKRIIGRHGGRVWAEGQPGVGATIYFTL